MQLGQISALVDMVPLVEKPIYRILVIDDDEGCATTLLWLMEDLGHIAQMALDGKTGLEMAKIFKPDIVLLDIGMPGMNGYEICKAMRKEKSLEKTLIIAQTGWSQKEHRMRSKEAGFDHHLVKPVDIAALKNIIAGMDKSGTEDLTPPLESVK